MIKIIVALGKNRLIGKGNSLPWHISGDLKHFKKTTTGHTVVMGEKTYESFGAKPLPNRKNIIVTLIPNYDPHSPEVEVSHDLVALAKKYQHTEEEMFVIGGAQIYRLFLPYADELVISYIKGDYTGDVYFPAFEDQFESYKIENHPEFDVYYYKRKS